MCLECPGRVDLGLWRRGVCVRSHSPVLQPDATWEPMPSLVKDAQGHTRHSASRDFTHRSERGPRHFLFFPWALGVIQEKKWLYPIPLERHRPLHGRWPVTAEESSGPNPSCLPWGPASTESSVPTVPEHLPRTWFPINMTWATGAILPCDLPVEQSMVLLATQPEPVPFFTPRDVAGLSDVR